MVSARVSSQQVFEKNYSKIRSYPPDSELHVRTVLKLIKVQLPHLFTHDHIQKINWGSGPKEVGRSSGTQPVPPHRKLSTTSYKVKYKQWEN